MADHANKPDAAPRPDPKAPPPGATPSSASRIDWKGVLPIPILLVGAVLLVGGVAAGVLRAPKVSPVVHLEAAKIAFDERKFDQALEVLNTQVRPAIEEGRLRGAGERDFFLLRARVLAGAQAAQGVRNAENDKRIVEDYERAKKLSAEWTEEDQAAVAESLVGAGRTAEAVAMAKALPPDLSDRRQSLFKKIVDANLRSRSVKFEETLALLGELLEDDTLSPDDRAWALGKQAELRLLAGFPEEAATKLLRALPKAQGLTPERQGELVFLLGRAYEKMGDLPAAAAQLSIAESLLPSTSPVRAQALVLGGKLKQAEGRLDEARERFLTVVEAEGATPTGAAALLGLAETIAGLGDDDAALERYRELMERLSAGSAGTGVSTHDAGTSLMDRYTDRQNSGALAVALRYALLAERAYRTTGGPAVAAGSSHATTEQTAAAAPAQDQILDPVPPAVFLAVGATHKALGERQLAEARTTETGQLSIDQVSLVTQAEVKRHLLDAGAAYREHARLVLVADDPAHADSLWNAAECFDLAGDRESAQACFALYAGRGDEDPRKAEAVLRMAQGFEAQRDYAAAASNYRELVDLASGPVSLRSIVPLARCYFADDQPGNDTDGEELLRRVLSAGTVGPESEVYRDALIELGERAHHVGQFPLAIEKLDEAVARYPDHERIGVLMFKGADAKRLSAADIDRELRGALPQARREELEKLRRERLAEAGEAFAAAAQALATKDPRQTTPMDVLALRNSTFYRGDVAFEQRDFARAITLYDTARQKYSTDPAALVAMVQIVNAYVAQRLWSEAITANERARQQLASLPDDTWNDPNLPMERKHWERWLDSGRLIDRQKGEVHNATSAAAQ